MHRRAFIQGALALAASSQLHAAQVQIGPPTPMGIPRRSWVNRPTMVKQNCPQWCWAASISMILATLGHPVAQEQIVSKVFGNLACAPAGTGLTMAQALSDTWIDTSGNAFRAHIVAAYDQMAGVNAINNAFIVNELNNDRPLLYANTHHAMVVATAEYYDAPAGPNIQSIGVLDPYPMSPDFHPLTMPEMVPAAFGGEMTFLAAVHV